MTILEDRILKEKKAHEDLKISEGIMLESMKTCTNLVKAEQRRLGALPGMLARLEGVAITLEGEVKALDMAEEAQLAEFQTLAKVLCNPCPPLNPTFVPTTTRTLVTQVSCSPCPVCCNGFHCNNWIPASCGHTYHPSCLFSLIGSSLSCAECMACGTVFLNDWLQSWGLPTSEPDVQTTHYIEELRGLYEKQSRLLCKRRQFGQHIQSAQERVCRITIDSVL